LLAPDDGDENLNDHDDGSIKENFREQDIYLPIANVARIMKNAVPQTGKVSVWGGQEGIIASASVLTCVRARVCASGPSADARRHAGIRALRRAGRRAEVC